MMILKIKIGDKEMPIEYKFKRTAADSPTRCQSRGGVGQCPFEAEPGFIYCPRHSGGHKRQEREESKRMYNLAKWQQRADEMRDCPQIKSLRPEIGILRMTLENIVSKCEDSTDLVIQSGKISDLVVKIEKLVGTCHRLEQADGTLMDKNAVINFAGRVIQVIASMIDDEKLVGAIGEAILAQLQEKTDEHRG